jgi:tRNA pseudouridine38-40 synthase
MRNIKLLLEYEGTNYVGWQVQLNGPSIQGEVLRAVKSLTGEAVKLTGASRTDSGVHSTGQVANFFTDSILSAPVIQRGLNAYLPHDIVVAGAEDVPPEFDSRGGVSVKTYIYSLMARPYASPLMRKYSWFIPWPLDIDAMREAAGFFPGGLKDFTSFRAAHSDAVHSRREVLSVEITEGEAGLVEIEVRGRAFLRHMVRIMAGTLVAVGLGKITPVRVGEIIEARDRGLAPKTAPAKGLLLKEIRYLTEQ